MSHERVHWEEVFIKRPHAVEEFKNRAGYPPSFVEDHAHDVLRELIMEAFNRDQERLINVRNTDKKKGRQFCFRLHPEGRQVVYACISYGHPEGRYTYMVHTVLSQEMYQSWSREGKLGTIGEATGESLTSIRQQLRKQTAEMKEAEKMAGDKDEYKYRLYYGEATPMSLSEDQVDKVVTDLLRKGVPLSKIELYRKVPLNIKINIGDG